MNLKHFILSVCLFITLSISAQKIKKDSIVIKDVYGLRVGIDISNPARTVFNNKRKSIELLADYRISKKIFVAIELGYLDKNTIEDYINFTTNGQYFKLGANYNLYENWLDMENEVFVGLRYGHANFKQTLNSYTVFSDYALPTIQNNEPITYSALNANWAELVFGLKVETFSNIFLGASFSFKKMISSKEPDNFKNLYIPGFDRVYLNNGGIGFNYSISYRLPLYKKRKANNKGKNDLKNTAE